MFRFRTFLDELEEVVFTIYENPEMTKNSTFIAL